MSAKSIDCAALSATYFAWMTDALAQILAGAQKLPPLGGPTSKVVSVMLFYAGLTALLVAYQSATDATRGFGAWYGVSAVLISVLWGWRYGLLGVTCYAAAMHTLWLDSKSIHVTWMLGAALPTAMAVMLAPYFVERSVSVRAMPAAPRSLASYAGALDAGSTHASGVIAYVRAGKPERLQWAMQDMVKDGQWGPNQIGFVAEVSRAIGGGPSLDWRIAVDNRAYDPSVTSKVDNAA